MISLKCTKIDTNYFLAYTPQSCSTSAKVHRFQALHKWIINNEIYLFPILLLH